MPGTGGSRVIQGVGFWAQRPLIFTIGGPFNQYDWQLSPAHYTDRTDRFWALQAQSTWIPLLETNKEFRPPLRGLPDQPPPPNAFQSWTWSYNQNLIGQDRMIVGAQRTELAPGQLPYDLTRLFTWQWGLNLPLYYLATSRNLNLVGVIADDLPPAFSIPRPIDPTWLASYNKNLVGQDQMVTGEQVTDRPTLPTLPALSYTFQFQALLTAIRPFNQFDWPTPISAPRLDQTWTWRYNLNLIGQDKLPFAQHDWPLPIPPWRLDQYWQQTFYFLGNVDFSTNKQFRGIWRSLPDQPAQPLQQQSAFPNYLLLQPPVVTYIIRQSDWPNPTQPYRIDQTWAASYNLNLIGQDRMIAGARSTELPPRDFARLFQTWINTVSLALVTAPPDLNQQVHIFDYPNPRGAEPDWRRSWEFSYNRNLIGQDQLPFRQQDWPLTPVPQRAAEWIQQTALVLTAVQRPFVQSDWPLPQVPQGAIQTWINTIGLALTAKPFNQQDWPNPTPFARDPTLSTIAASYNRNLIGQDRLPNRQQDWPLPAPAPQPLLQIMVAGKPFFLVPPQPLPPGVQLYDRLIDPRNAAADIAWPAWSWPQITPPPVSAVVPLRTLMGTGV